MSQVPSWPDCFKSGIPAASVVVAQIEDAAPPEGQVRNDPRIRQRANRQAAVEGASVDRTLR